MEPGEEGTYRRAQPPCLLGASLARPLPAHRVAGEGVDDHRSRFLRHAYDVRYREVGVRCCEALEEDAFTPDTDRGGLCPGELDDLLLVDGGAARPVARVRLLRIGVHGHVAGARRTTSTVGALEIAHLIHEAHHGAHASSEQSNRWSPRRQSDLVPQNARERVPIDRGRRALGYPIAAPREGRG